MNNKKITLTYILLHVMFWCGYAIAWSYTAVYLKNCGYDNSVVGLVTGIGAVVSVILQPVLASFTAKTEWLNNRNNVILLKAISVIFTIFVMIKPAGTYSIAILFVVITAIDASIPSILSSIAMDYVNFGKNINYGMARGIGSIAYALFSLFLGYAVSDFGADSLMAMYGVLGVVTIIVTFMVPYDMNVKNPGNKIAQDEKNDGESLRNVKKSEKENNVLKRYPFLIYFLVAAVLLFMGHNMVNMLLINIIERAGGNSENLGIALAIAAGVELPVMVYFVKLAVKINVEKLLVISAVFFMIKNIITIFAINMPMVYVMQFLQFGAFALFTPASVYFVNKAMSHKDAGVGQALLGSCSLGLGGTLGNVFGGILLDTSGLEEMLVFATVLSGVGIILMAVSYNLHKKKM